MNVVFRASCVMLIFMLTQLTFAKKKRSWLYYVIFFIFFLCTSFLYEKANADAINFELPNPEIRLTLEKRDEFIKKIEAHIRMGHEWMGQAEGQARLIPDWTLSQMTITAIENTIILITSGNPAVQVCSTLLLWLREYLQWKEPLWKNIDYCVFQARYNFEMADFYQDVIFNDGA